MSNQVTSESLSNILIANGFAWKFEFATSLAAAASINIGIATGAMGAIISDRGFSTDSTDALFVLYRGTSFTGGTPVTLANRSDRFWADSSKLPGTVASGVTAIPSAANAMGSVRLRTGGPIQSTIGADSQNICLAPNSNYVITLTNNGAALSSLAISAVLFQDRITSGIIKWV